MELLWHAYKYYPYEQDLALREARKLLTPDNLHVHSTHVEIAGDHSITAAERLVYFSGIRSGTQVTPTTQRELEASNGSGARQNTRYSAHGLHEYKGKFNPQIAKFMLNFFEVSQGDRALDPFCGSGTSLIECAHLGVEATGVDINPLAVFIANAKLLSLKLSAERILEEALSCVKRARSSRQTPKVEDERGVYLASWFDADQLVNIERLQAAILMHAEESRDVLLALASNLLRDYSLQEPQDLRIRRRKSPYPEVGFLDAFEHAARAYTGKLSHSQSVLRRDHPASRALLSDSSTPLNQLSDQVFDVALTSPPYATALPYIDTQRLSLVWLRLLEPAELLQLESELVGSREMRGKRGKIEALAGMEENRARLPGDQWEYCRALQAAIGPSDGFRRRMVPTLLYRYFSGMAQSFQSVRKVMRAGGMYGLVVGGNHTVLGGERFDIATPDHLASLAMQAGWKHCESIPLQTYQRFGLHSTNATTTETLVILQAT